MSDYDHEGIIRDVHVHALESPTPSMPTTDQLGFSNTSVTNSTLVLAGSPAAARTIENDGSSIWGFGSMREDRASIREVSVASVRSCKKEEVESKISAWKNAKIAEINNRFKREEAVINGWASEQAQLSTLRMKKLERKLEEKRVRAVEKMENEIAKAHQKAEERRASAEAKRGTKIGRVLEVANLMKAVGRAPVKNSFF